MIIEVEAKSINRAARQGTHRHLHTQLRQLSIYNPPITAISYNNPTCTNLFMFSHTNPTPASGIIRQPVEQHSSTQSHQQGTCMDCPSSTSKKHAGTPSPCMYNTSSPPQRGKKRNQHGVSTTFTLFTFAERGLVRFYSEVLLLSRKARSTYSMTRCRLLLRLPQVRVMVLTEYCTTILLLPISYMC